MTSKEKSFYTILGAVTAVCAGGLSFWAVSAGSRYAATKEQFDTVVAEIQKMESLPLYPTPENQAAKSKALVEYKGATEVLVNRLKAYRPKDLVNTQPQTFTDALKKAAKEVKDAYATAGLSIDEEKGALPKSFYLGFETYTSGLAQQSATGLLTYQLAAIAELHEMLAAAKPVALNNFYRLPLEEEKGEVYVKKTDEIARALPIEISFACQEATLRQFLTSLVNSKKYYFVVRTLRVTNEKTVGPKAQDAEFTKPESAAPAGGDGFGLPGGDAFVLPGDNNATAAAAAPAAPVATKSSEQILKQVLGSEKIHVFMRIDQLLFDDSVKVP